MCSLNSDFISGEKCMADEPLYDIVLWWFYLGPHLAATSNLLHFKTWEVEHVGRHADAMPSASRFPFPVVLSWLSLCCHETTCETLNVVLISGKCVEFFKPKPHLIISEVRKVLSNRWKSLHEKEVWFRTNSAIALNSQIGYLFVTAWSWKLNKLAQLHGFIGYKFQAWSARFLAPTWRRWRQA